jgi:hypothetical protein
MKLRLDYTATTPISPLLAFGSVNFGVFDPLTRTPRYYAQMFALYRYAFVHSIDVHVEMVNTGSKPFTVALAETNTDDFPSLTMKILSETPKAKWSQVTINGNKTDVSLRYHADGQAIRGTKLRQDSAYWLTAATGISVPYLPELALGYESTTLGTPMEAIRTIRIYYNIEFFTLNPQT